MQGFKVRMGFSFAAFEVGVAKKAGCRITGEALYRDTICAAVNSSWVLVGRIYRAHDALR
jgi:hypothetical protein